MVNKNKALLKKFEGYVKSQARRYAGNPSEIEDFEQIGRIAIWQKLEKEPSAHISHVLSSSKYAMINYINKGKAQKRKPREKIISIDTLFESNRGVSDRNKEIIFEKDLIVFMKESLREKFGKRYYEGIKELDFPKKTIRRIFRAAIEEIAEIGIEDVPSKVTYNFFKKMKLDWPLWVFYDNSPASAIMDIYKNKFVPWQFPRVPAGYWKGKVGTRRTRQALEWFCKKKNIKSEKDCREIRCDDFGEEGLRGMLHAKFQNSPYLALKSVFPNLNLKDKKYIKNYFDTREKKMIAVTDYLVEIGIGDISDMTPEELYDTDFKTKIKTPELRKKFSGLMKQYKGSSYLLFKDLFPNQILPWSIYSPYGWRGNYQEGAKDAVKWLFEKYLQIPIEEIPSYATLEFFKKIGFWGLLTNKKIGFNSSPYLAINNAYPGLFDKKDFDRHRKTRNIEFILNESRRNIKKNSIK